MSLHFSNDSSGLILCGQRVNDAQYIPGRSLLRLPLFPGLRFTVPLRTFHWSWFRLRRRIQRVHHAVISKPSSILLGMNAQRSPLISMPISHIIAPKRLLRRSIWLLLLVQLRGIDAFSKKSLELAYDSC